MRLDILRTYVSERVKESERLKRWAAENGHEFLEHSHRYSAIVGKQILEEIDEEIINLSKGQ